MRRWRWAAGFAGGAAVLAACAAMALSSDWFAGRVKRAIISRTEAASGGKVDLGSLHFDWRTMRVTAKGFVLHGREEASRAALFTAPEVTIDLQVASFVRRDIVLSRLSLKRPQIHIYVGEDGTTNLPSPPKPDPKSDPIANLLKTKIRRLEVEDGTFEYDSRKLAFRVAADQFAASLDYRHVGPAYKAALSMGNLQLNEFSGTGLDARMLLQAGKVVIEEAIVRRRGAEARVTGELADLKQPSFTGSAQVVQPLGELGVSGMRGGVAKWDAAVRWDGRGYEAKGPLRVDGFEWNSESYRIRGASLTSEGRLKDGVATLESATIRGAGGSWSGRAELKDRRALELKGAFSGVALSEALRTIPGVEFPWDGAVSGPMTLACVFTSGGIRDTVVDANLNVTPAEDRMPAEGTVNVRWRQAEGLVELTDSTVRLPSTELHVSGALGGTLTASLATRDAAELEAAGALFLDEKKWLTPYVTLNGGEARLDAVVKGPLASPVFSGRVELTRFTSHEVAFDSGSADFRVSASSLELPRVELTQSGVRSTGTAAFSMDKWRVNGDKPMKATANLRRFDAASLRKIAGIETPLGGRITAAALVEGTPDAPRGTMTVEWQGATVGAEQFKLVTAKFSGTAENQFTVDAFVSLDGDPVAVRAAYDHPRADWRNGRVKVHASAKGLRLEQFEEIHVLREDVSGSLESDLTADIRVAGGKASLESVSGFVSAPFSTKTVAKGALRVDVSTANNAVRLRAQGSLDGQEYGGEGRIHLTAGYPVDGRLALPRLSMDSVQRTARGASAELWPVQGFVGGDVSVKGNLSEPSKMTARVVVTRLQLAPREGSILEGEVEKSELELRNAAPITIDIDSNGAYVRPARFVAKETALTVAGFYSFSSRSPLDLSLNGTVNLDLLTLFNSDLIAKGTARLSANMRGSASDPSLNGQMKISGASFFLRDVPTGVVNASGTVSFDRNRMQVESLTGQTGGGNFKISGFVGFGAKELTYRLAADAEAIRVRYPEGVSTTADAALTLTGTSNRALLAGLITVRKSGFNMKQDLGSIITGSSTPIPVPSSQNAFLRNLQFDVRVKTSPNATFQTSYTRDLQTRADLRLRGSPAKPVILGSVEVNQGEVLFFGNQYTISRGELLFFNTASIQPSIDLDLETRMRGVTVYINVSGPLSRLDVNYRSEPPLPSSEILALLTVGRDPTTTSSSIPTTIPARATALGPSNTNTLLGGALSASVSSRVQKFFGASRIKIDPNSTGVENLPQARLTIEQSLSRNVIFTYSINLSESSKQIVRMEWDVSDDWSLVAVRDENGAFGVDFLFNRRFK